MTPSCSGSSSGACTEHTVSNWSILGKSTVSFVSLVPAILADIPSWSLCLFSGIFFTLHFINHCLPRIINTTTTIITTMTRPGFGACGLIVPCRIFPSHHLQLIHQLVKINVIYVSRSWSNFTLVNLGYFSSSSHRPTHLLEETFERTRKESIVSNSSST